VATGVVDDLELIEIHVEQRRALTGPGFHGREHRGQPLLDLASIDESRERVMAREIREPAVQLPLLAHVVEHHHRTDRLAVTVLNRCSRVLNRDRRAVARDEHHVVRQRDDTPLLQTACDGIRNRFAALLVAQPDQRFDRRALHLPRLPARELLRDRVQVLDVAVRVRRHDGVADRLQRDLRAFLLVEEGALRGLALRDVRDRPFEVQRVSVGGSDEPRVLEDDDLAAGARPKLILEVAHTTVRHELADEARALLGVHEEFGKVAAADCGFVET
jgi:hypothetical protein